jgi:hypothetical protein
MSFAQPAKSRNKRPSSSTLPTGGSRGAARKPAGNLGAAASGGRGIRSTYQSPRPPRPAAGGRRKTTGAGGLGFAPLTSAALSSGALSRGRRGVRKAVAATRAAAPTARKPASAATRAKMSKAMKEHKRDLSAFKKSAAGSKSQLSARAKAETAARRPSGRKAETAARKKAQSAQMADRKKYGRATAEFAKKRAVPASPAQKRRANQSGGKPSPRQGGYKKAAQAMRAEHVKRTRATNQRRASAAKRVSGRGVRGPGLGRGRR